MRGIAFVAVLLMLAVTSCGGGGATTDEKPSAGGSTNSNSQACPVPPDIEGRVRAAYSSGPAPGHVIVVGGRSPAARFTFTVPQASGGNRFEDVDLQPCAADAAQKLVDELEKKR